jgi:two-component system phosphate regulon sensor histidine kinase PhoR
VIWLQALAPIGIALAIAAVLAALFDDTAAAWWLAGFLVVYGLVHAGFVARLYHWAALPRNRDLPLGGGVWAPVFARLARFARLENEARAVLSDELRQIHSAVDRLPDGLVVLDRFDHVEWANNAAAELHGVFGTRRPIHHFIRQPEFVSYLDGQDYSRPPVLALATRPGRLFELRLHRTEENSKLLITRDVTDQAKLDAMRRDFVANVSHEIRTPVTVIAGFAETLLELELDEASRREYLHTILRQSRTMQRLVEDLLTLSSLENASAPPADERIDLHALVRTLAGEARVLSGNRHTIEVDLEAPPLILGTPMEIESAIRNLLTNAVRYTPDGGRIDIEWRLRGADGWLTVRDTGIGIAREHLPRLTERFYRVDRGRSRDSGGTGLGLAIVKHIVQRHDGQLVVESQLGQGSAFTLKLPARRLVAAPSPLPAPEAPDESGDPAPQAAEH